MVRQKERKIRKGKKKDRPKEDKKEKTVSTTNPTFILTKNIKCRSTQTTTGSFGKSAGIRGNKIKQKHAKGRMADE